MSIRSVDLQTLYPKVQEAGRVQQAREESVQAAQQQFASQLAGQVERESAQVNQTPQARGSRVGDQAGKGRPGRREPSEHRAPEHEEEEKAGDHAASPPARPGEPGQRLDLKA